MDSGQRETEREMARLEQDLKAEYSQAAREVAAKAEDYWRRHEAKDRTWRQWVENGRQRQSEINQWEEAVRNGTRTLAEYQRWKSRNRIRTESDYRAWLSSQLMAGKRWEDLRDSLANELTHADMRAMEIINGYMPRVYVENHAYGTYEIEGGAMISTSYTIYPMEAVQFIFMEDPELLPEPGKKLSKEIAEGRAQRWNKRHVQSVMTQAILQGNSIPDIATRLANAVGERNRAAAIRNARTMATSTLNKGRLDAYKRGEDMGIETEKEWNAAIDMRTRHEHRLLNGMRAKLDEKFKVEGEEIAYPGDPEASPHMVWGCRCTIIAKVKGFRSMSGGNPDLSQIDGMTYEEWRDSRKVRNRRWESVDERQDEIRAQYIREYRGYGGPVASGRDTTLNIDRR